MENTEVTETKKFNKSNLPFLIFVFVLLATILLSFISVIIQHEIIAVLILTLDILLFPLFFIACPIGLIFQFLHKEKTTFDKWILGLNLVCVTLLIAIVIFIRIAFPNDFVKEKDVRAQINNEYSILNKEYKPVLDYLSQYKKQHGVYPKSIDEKIIPNSETFEMYKYNTSYDGKGYWLQVYPKNAPIEYYYNDENDNGYNYYNGDGYIDGFLDNDYYYKIDDTWHAIMLQHFTRHSIVWNGGHTERETDEWMKTNADKFEKAESEVKQKREKVK